MPHLAIIADDLTGALDSAAPFAGCGKVIVATCGAALDRALNEGPDVIAVSTRSREIDADQAGARVHEVLAQLPPGIRIFKKIDSRLKGNIEAELAPFGDRALLVAPAIPEFGRIVQGGRVTGFGVPDPIEVATRLGRMAAHAAIPDTASAAQMAAALRAVPQDTILVGARGLAQALTESFDADPSKISALPGPICFVVGSTDPITLEQVAELRRACPDLHHVKAPAGVVPQGAISGAPITVLQITPGEDTPREVAANRFAQGALAWVAQARTLLLTGGATAEAVLDAQGIDVLTITGEMLPGLPCCTHGTRRIITKSGGFGDADALVRLAKMVKFPERCGHD